MSSSCTLLEIYCVRPRKVKLPCCIAQGQLVFFAQAFCMWHSESLLMREQGYSKERVGSVDGFCPGHLRSSLGIGVDCHIGTICHGQSQEAVLIILLQQTDVFLLLLAQSVFHDLQLEQMATLHGIRQLSILQRPVTKQNGKRSLLPAWYQYTLWSASC